MVLDIPAFRTAQPRSHASVVRTEKLGLVRAIVIVWVSGFVFNLVVGAFFVQTGLAFTIATGSLRHGDSRPWVAAALYIGMKALLGALVVTFAVRLMGFHVSYAVAALALAVGALLTTALTFATFSTVPNDPTGMATPGVGVLLFPLGIVLGTLLPAYLIDSSTMRESEAIPPGRPYSGTPL